MGGFCSSREDGEENEEGRDCGQVRRQVRCFAQKTDKKDRDYATLQVCVRILREELRQTHGCGYLGLQGMRQDDGGWRMDLAHIFGDTGAINHPAPEDAGENLIRLVDLFHYFALDVRINSPFPKK